MFLHKANHKTSSRHNIQIQEVKDNILILPHNEYRTIIETSSINFELKTEEEQDVLIDSFQNFLNSLSCPLQIIIRVREIDVDRYLEEIAKKQDRESEAIYKQHMKHYATFIKDLVAGNKILSRKFYIVIPYTGGTRDFALNKEQVLLNQDIVSKGLEKLGMKARQLTSLEILDLFYTFYNPQHAKLQPLTEDTMRFLFTKSHEFIQT